MLNFRLRYRPSGGRRQAEDDKPGRLAVGAKPRSGAQRVASRSGWPALLSLVSQTSPYNRPGRSTLVERRSVQNAARTTNHGVLAIRQQSRQADSEVL